MKKVIFDTSFLNAAKKVFYDTGINHLDDNFPNVGYERIVHDYVLDELLRKKTERAINAEFYAINNLWTMHSSDVVIKDEFVNGVEHYDLYKDVNFESNIIPYLKGNHKNQNTWNRKHKIKIKEREKAREDVYARIRSQGIETKFELTTLEKIIFDAVNAGFTAYLDAKQDSVIEIKGNNFTLKKNGTVMHIRIVQNIKVDLPSLYNFLIAEQFINNITKRQKHPKANTEIEFTLEFAELKKNIKFEKNTLADFQISLSGLHYCDGFATCDKGQASLIKLLYPQYESKLQCYDRKTLQLLSWIDL